MKHHVHPDTILVFIGELHIDKSTSRDFVLVSKVQINNLIVFVFITIDLLVLKKKYCVLCLQRNKIKIRGLRN